MLFRKASKWKPLAGGTYNQVYLNTEATLVFKEVHNTEFDTDTPERSVRLWNLLNPHLRPKAKIATVIIDRVKVYGWTCPYVQSKYETTLSQESLIGLTEQQRIEHRARNKVAYVNAMRDPTLKNQEDEDIANALINIYNRTGRIVVDAAGSGNFITTAAHGVVCVDIGMALLLEDKETNCLDMYARRNSFVSNNAWEQVHTDLHSRVLKDKNLLFPKTAAMTKALLFIRAYRPDIAHVNFLKNYQAVEQLGQAYDVASDTAHETGMALLDKEQPVMLISLKQNCERVLLDYIHSRGALDENKTFKARGITQYFRNALLTTLKVDSAQLLIKKIQAAHSIEEIQRELSKASSLPILLKGRNSGFSTSLGLCKIISQVPPSSPELTHTQHADM